MPRKTKTVTMTVTVRCPSWLTAAQARKEVRSLVNYQAFWGHLRPDGCDDVGDHNFRATKVGAA